VTGRVHRPLVALALCAVLAPEAHAQTGARPQPAPPQPRPAQPAPPQPGVPQPGAPGAGQAPGRAETLVDVMVDGFGGYDTAVDVPPGGFDGSGTGETDQRTFGANAALTMAHTGRNSFRVLGNASARSFPAFVDGVVQAYSGSATASLAVGRRGTLGLRQGAAYQPINLLGLFSTSTGTGPAAPSQVDNVPGADFGLSSDLQFSSDSDGSFTYGLSRTARVRGGGGYSVARVPLSDVPEQFDATGWLRRWRATGGYDQSFGRYASLTLGYSYSTDSSSVGRVPTAGTLHGIDTGFRYGRPLGFSRRTFVAGNVGTGAIDTPVAPIQYSLVGGFSVNHEFGRTWEVAANVQRDIRFIPAFVLPVTSNTATLSLSGGLAERTTLGVTGLYTRGAVGTAALTPDDLRSQSASVQVRHGLTDEFGVFGEVFYVNSEFAPGFSPLGTSLTSLGRTGVRIGASLGRQIAGRRRN
jgi:hypothetical protein